MAVPVYDEEDLEEATSPDKVAPKTSDKMRIPTAEEYEEIKEMHQRSVFKRGGMKFEDYNYRSLNKFILVNRDVPGAAETSEEEVQSDIVSKKYYQPGQNADPVGDLNENVLEQSVDQEPAFLHKEFDTETQEEKERARIAEIEKEKEEAEKAEQARLEQIEAAKEQSEQGEEAPSKKGDEEEAVEGSDYADDAIEYEVFYEISDIKAVKENQRMDPFEELYLEQTLLINTEGLENLRALNKFNIEDYMPKEPEDEKKTSKQKDSAAADEELRRQAVLLKIQEEERRKAEIEEK